MVSTDSDAPAPRNAEEPSRRAWIWHSLFAASLGIPTAIAASDPSASLGTRTATVALATVWAGLYLLLVRRVTDWERLGGSRMFVGYFAVSLVFATILIQRNPAYFLLVYGLYPQAFLFLGRWKWAGVVMVTLGLAVGVVPRAQDEPAATASVIASGAVAMAIGYFIEGVHGQSRRRRQALDELHMIHTATAAVAAARTSQAVCAALVTHLGSPGDSVTIARSGTVTGPGLVVPLSSTRDDDLVVTREGELTSDERARWNAIGPHVGVVLDNLRLADRARAAGVLEERERLAREVHDNLAQALTSIVTQLEAAEGALPQRPQEVTRRLGIARQSARQGLEAARAFVRDKRPAELVDATLTDAVGHLVERWSEQTSIPARYSTSGAVRHLSPAHEAALLRVAQEALANIYQHAAAHQAVLNLRYDAGEVRLEVDDDGVGFETADPPGSRDDGSGYGLRTMRDRTEELGGRLDVRSGRGEGTTISAALPVPPGQK